MWNPTAGLTFPLINLEKLVKERAEAEKTYSEFSANAESDEARETARKKFEAENERREKEMAKIAELDVDFITIE